jgi:hypothetical protein
MDIKNYIGKHPYLSSALPFIIYSLPQWISSVWALFSTQPLANVISEGFRKMNIPSFELAWITTPIALGLFAWIIYEVRRQGNTNPGKSVCVKRVWIHYNRLEKDHVIDILFEIFNGSNFPVTIANLSGKLILQIDKVNEILTPIQKVPLEISPYSEDRIFVEQVLSADLKQRFLNAVEQKTFICFDLSKLNINARFKAKSKTEFSLPKWDMFGSYPPSDVTKFDIIISMKIDITV